ncbi:MAG: hypothetical protein ACYDEQ_13970 [Desulfocucumaceae bacterium]
MGTDILMVLGLALGAAIVAMLVSGTAQDITLAATKHENMGDQHH